MSKDKGYTFQYSRNGEYKDTTNEFELLLNRAIYEHKQTAVGVVDNQLRSSGVTPTDEITDFIVLSSINEIGSRVENIEEQLINNPPQGIFISEQEVREFTGFLNPQGTIKEKIDSLEVNSNHYRLKALNESDPVKEAFYKSVRDVCELKADNIRMEAGEKQNIGKQMQ